MSSDWMAAHNVMPIGVGVELVELVKDAAPLVAVAAFKGGSLFYKQWVDKARGLGIEVVNPTDELASQDSSECSDLE